MVLLRCWSRGAVAGVESKRPACAAFTCVVYEGRKGDLEQHQSLGSGIQAQTIPTECTVRGYA